MSTCWKCERELPEGQTECEYGCQGQKTEGGGQIPEITDAQIKEVFRRQEAKTFEIDWDKLQTIEDVRAFLRANYGDRIYFSFGVPEAIKPFLKPKEDK